MPNSCQVTLNGTVYQCQPQTIISTFLHDNNFNIDLPCGGRGTCGKCQVYATGALSEPAAAELKQLGAEALAENIRLACHAKIIGDCAISLIAKDELVNIAVSGVGNIIIDQPLYQNYGIAVDIGTTTIAMKLFDGNGELGYVSGRNSQIKYGADVITRIDKSLRGQSEEIQSSTAKTLNEMFHRLCGNHQIELSAVDAVVITGNTAMMYLLSGQNPDALAHTPFIADRLFGEYVQPGSLGLELDADCRLYLCKCIGAYVGGDISSAILASGITEHSETALLVDVGTNGEMALWHQGKLVCCSTAAGPAFEGAEIALGMQAAKGAVDRLWLDEGKIRFSTIDNAPAVGICGSGIIDAISLLKNAEFIDETGMMQQEALEAAGVLLLVDDKPACRITDKVYITQKDVRMVQLAKSAICAGILTMLKELELQPAEITTLYLAGGFGNYLDIKSAGNIGLVPQELAYHTIVIGNAALQGAAQTLTSSSRSEKTLVEGVQTTLLELGANKHFMDYYISCMEF
jgi:uncharacterized 2Fe-2S/4Fe-4S cluster protein (DUF4445 family)